jgi:hypothetical protein
MSTIQSDTKSHEKTVNLAESVRQVEVAAAGGSAAAVKTAEIKFYRAFVASCLANGNLESGIARAALRELGVAS